MESHNHPSYIDPYQGAATGVGGIMRDVFCMARVRLQISTVYDLVHGHIRKRRNSMLTSCAELEITEIVSEYQQVAGDLYFDSSYDGNCLVNAITVGLVRESAIFKGYASRRGKSCLYVGSATGRDGVQGATMASGSFTRTEEGERSSIQVATRLWKNFLLEATFECLQENLVIGLQDMGAAGLTSSAFEMADRAGLGLFLN